VYGEHLKQQVENRLKFYETGETPAKNAEVMKQAEAEVRLYVVNYHHLLELQCIMQAICMIVALELRKTLLQKLLINCNDVVICD